MTRREAREFCMKCAFEMDAQNIFVNSTLDKYLEAPEIDSQRDYIEKLLNSLLKYKEPVDMKIEENSVKWNLGRMPKADLAILRIAVTEILFTDIPKAIAANEAVELAKAYGTEDSSKFINGILKNIEK